MDNWLLYILMVGAIAIGWWLGRRERFSGKSAEAIGPNYYEGLNFLLKEQPDRAVATFIQDLEVNNDTLETHLALGGLLRRRGELEKAVVVHENILSKAKLERGTVLKVRLELARDYLLAGLLDRAEALLLELVQEEGHIQRESLRLLLEIYEREKEWTRAIETARRLVRGNESEKYDHAIAHYYGEIALEQMEAHGLNVTEPVHRRVRESLQYAVWKARRRGMKRIPAELVPYLDASQRARIEAEAGAMQ